MQGELELTYNTQIDVLQADFSRFNEVQQVAGQILENYPHIDMLINNVELHNTQRTGTAEGFDMVFCVNRLASFLFMRLLLDRMIASASASIIQVNSQGHHFGGLDLSDLAWEQRRYRRLQGYGASKVAQLLTV